MSAPPRVTVAVVAYQSGDYLQACVDALAAQSFSDFEAVIADNASTDGSVERLRLPDERFRVAPMGANLGFAAANNRVADLARGEFLALLNPDAVPEPAWLATLIDAARRWLGAAAFGSTQLSLDDPRRLDGVGDVWHAAGVAWRAREGRSADLVPAEAETFSPCAAAALYRLTDWRDAGGFDERYFCYAEDVDLGFRLRLMGRASVQVPTAVVRHAGSAISGRKSEFTVFHGHRNRIWTYVKDTPGWLFWATLPYHLAVNTWLLVALGRQGLIGPLWRAYVAAAHGLPGVWADRRRVQRLRRASVSEVGRAMAWSLNAIRRRDVLGGRLPIWNARLRAAMAAEA